MRHITRSEMILYRLGMGLTEEERAQIAQHFDECRACRKEFEQAEKELEKTVEESRTTCDRVRDELMFYMDGMLLDEREAEIKHHLEECDSCRLFYHRVNDVPEQLEAVVPGTKARPGLLESILRHVQQHLESQSFYQTAKRWKERLGNIWPDILTTARMITLTLEPMQARAALLSGGRETGDVVVLAHGGGDIRIKCPTQGFMVELLTMDNTKLDEISTNADGEAVFINYMEGYYKVSVQSHLIVDADATAKS